MSAKTIKPIEIAVAGRHVAMSGAVVEFSESDLDAMIGAYDPAVYKAAICIGHPKHNLPRYGGVKAIVRNARGVVAVEPCDVVPEFAEWVDKKLFTGVSGSMWGPSAPGNPRPGSYYLRHVGFLGAVPPAIKGLNPDGIELAAADDGVIEFADLGLYQNASLWRRMREWFIGAHGMDAADKVIPAYAVETLEDVAREEAARRDGDIASPSFSDPATTGDTMSADDKARLEALEAENAKLKADAANAVRAAQEKSNLDFAEGLVKDGRLAPALKGVTVAALNALAAQEQVVEFGEGDAKGPLVDVYKAALQSAPKIVEFSELSADAGKGIAAGAVVNFAAPDGLGVDPGGLKVHQAALAHQAAHAGTSYLDAVRAVSKS